MVKRAYGGVALFPSYKKAKVMAQIKAYKPRIRSLTPEVKHNISTVSTRLYGGGTFSHTELLLDGIGQGVDQNQRIGRKLSLTSIEMDLVFTLGATTVEYDAGFWSLVYDKRSNGSAPLITDMYVYQGSNIGNAVTNENGHPGRFVEIARGDWAVGIAAGWNKRFIERLV